MTDDRSADRDDHGAGPADHDLDVAVDDAVIVRTLDDDEARGTVVGITPDRAVDRPAPYLETDATTLYDYWRGTDVSPDDRVVLVGLGTDIYDVPASRLRREDP